METSYLNINGQLIPREKAGLSTSNRAFKYGDGIFETIRVKNGLPLFMVDHYERLCQGISALKMIQPQGFSEEYLHSEAVKLIRKNELNKGGRLRLSVYRTGNGLYTPEKNDLAWVMELGELEHNDFVLNKKGLILGIYKERRMQADPLHRIKTVNKLPYILAGIYAKEHGWDDCLLENQNGNLMEAVSANVFLRMGNTYYTPPITDGGLPGTMRKHIIHLIKHSGGTVIENSIRASHLEQVDEVFLTNSISGIRWVGAYEHKRFFHDKGSDLIQQLNKSTSLSISKENTEKSNS